MDSKKNVRVKLWSDRKHYTIVEVCEDDVEKVKTVNRMNWQEDKAEERKRIKLEEEGITISSLESLDEDGVWIADKKMSAEEKMIAEETRTERNSKVCEAIKQLKERQQLVVKLIYFEGLSQREVAVKLGISEFALSHALSVILVNLKKFLKEV